MNKVAFITGAGGYIGNAVALALAKTGIKVAVCDINIDAAKNTVEEIERAGGEAFALCIDVTDSASVDAAVEGTVEKYGRLDISIHIAGGSARVAGANARYTTLTNQTDAVIDAVLKTNLYGAMYVSRAASRQMIKQGHSGRIINFSSIVGVQGLKHCTEYAAAKGGVIAMTRSFAKEMGEYGITVNSVAPGIVSRPGENDESEYVYKSNFLNKKCIADDVANLVEFLVSDKAGFITGQTYIIDGGRSLAMKGSD